MTARSPRRRDRRAPVRARPARPVRLAAHAIRSVPFWLVIVLVIAAGTAAYVRGFGGPFIFDDELAIERNPDLHQWPDLGRVLRSAPPESPLAGRPLVSLSFAANSAIGGLDVRGYRATNLAIHLVSALLIFGIIRRTAARTALADSADAIALAAALVWVVHPLNSEAVSYLTQRTELMMGVFAFATLYSSVRAVESPFPVRWQAAAVAASALGMACKETMVTVPVLVVVYDRIFLFPSFGAALAARGRFYAALAASWAVLAALMWSAPRTIGSGFSSTYVSPWHYLLQQTEMIARYLRLTVWPRDLVLYYGWAGPATPGAVLPEAIFVMLLAAATIAALRRAPAIGFLGAWVFITLAPTSSFVPIASEVGAERRMYLPLAAIVVLFVVAARWLWRRAVDRRAPALAPYARPAAVAAAGAAVVLLGWQTQARTLEYASALTMAETVYERWPSGGAAHMLGTELVEAGRGDEGIALLRQAAASFPPAHFDLGLQLFKSARFGEAIDHLRQFIRYEPNLTYTQTAELLVAQALTIDQRPAEAIAHLQEVRKRRPHDADATGLLADAYFARGQFEDAIREYRAFLAVYPDRPEAIASLAIACVNTGRMDEAIDHFRRAAALQPQNLQFGYNLTRALLDRGTPGDVEEAARRAAALISAAPNEAPPYGLQGLGFERQRRFAEARAAYQRALALDPDHTPAREGLARISRRN